MEGANNTKSWRFNLRWRKENGWELENQLSASYKTLMSMCRGKEWCLSPSSSSPTILSVYAHHLLQSAAWGLQPTSVWCVVVFIGIKCRARTTQLLTRIPLHEKPTELQITWLPNVHLPFQNPVVHTHFSMIIVVSQIHRVFFKKWHVSCWEKLTHITKKPSCPAGHL